MNTKRLQMLPLLLALLLLSACGGGGGGDGTAAPPPADGQPPDGSTRIPLTAALQQGAYWEFAVNTEVQTFAQGSGPTSTSDFGLFRLALGAPVQIGGSQVYPVSVTGDTDVGGHNFAPRWTFLGISGGSIVGSADGVTLQIIYSGATTSGAAEGFFIDFAAGETVVAAADTFTGQHNTLSAIRAGHASAEGGCEVILGITVCSETSTSFSESEYYKDGIGPLGFKQDISYTSSGGNFFTSHAIKYTLELTKTSLAASDGATIKPAPWKEVAPLLTARQNHTAAAYNNKIYVFGGVDSAGVRLASVEIYDPAFNAWSAGTSAPVELASYRAETVGTRAFLIGSNSAVRIFNHATNTWTMGAIAPFNDPSFDTDVWVDTVNGKTFIVVIASNLTGSQIDVYGYEVKENLWYSGTSLSTTDHRWFAVSVIGNDFYLAGGYRQFLSAKVFGGTYRYSLSTDTWTTSGLAALDAVRYDAEAVNLNGRMVLLGGQNLAVSALRDAESYDPATNVWTKLAPMLRARKSFAAVALAGKVYAIGGTSGGGTPLLSVEVYAP